MSAAKGTLDADSGLLGQEEEPVDENLKPHEKKISKVFNTTDKTEIKAIDRLIDIMVKSYEHILEDEHIACIRLMPCPGPKGKIHTFDNGSEWEHLKNARDQMGEHFKEYYMYYIESLLDSFSIRNKVQFHPITINKIDIKLTDRPQKISVEKFLMIVKEYENNLN